MGKIMKHIKLFESFVNEAMSDSAIQKKVDAINAMIKVAFDKDGDPLEIIDKSSTWEAPMKYKPIVYKNKNLFIEYSEYDGSGKDKVKKERITKANMEYDGIPQLNLIARLYKAALKKNNIKIDEAY